MGAACDGQTHLELLHPPVREGQRHHGRSRRLQAVGREGARAHRSVPGKAQRRGRLHAHVADVEPPAVAEVAPALVAAVVGPGHTERLAGHRHLEVHERDGEVADLEVVAHHDDRRRLRRSTGVVGGGQAYLVDPVHQHRRVELPECGGRHRRRARGEGRPCALAPYPMLQPPPQEVRARHAADDVHGLADSVRRPEATRSRPKAQTRSPSPR